VLPKFTSRTLHHGPAGSGLATHEQGDPDDSLIADNRDSAEAPFSITYRSETIAVVGKVNMTQRVAWFVQYLAEWHVDQLTIRQPALPIRSEQGCQQVIVFGVISSSGQTLLRKMGLLIAMYGNAQTSCWEHVNFAIIDEIWPIKAGLQCSAEEVAAHRVPPYRPAGCGSKVDDAP
jgi:hypothetical protein